MLERLAAAGRRLAARLRRHRIGPTEPPRTITDGQGREIHFRRYRGAEFEGLVAMYDDFDPAQRTQGTPPTRTEAVRDWIRDILDGVNAVAIYDERVVGHVTSVRDGSGRHGLAIFVDLDYQRAGIGTDLLAIGLGHARERGVGYVRLTVEAWKRDAHRLYQRAGFSTVNPLGAAHRTSRYR